MGPIASVWLPVFILPGTIRHSAVLDTGTIRLGGPHRQMHEWLRNRTECSEIGPNIVGGCLVHVRLVALIRFRLRKDEY